MNCRQAEKDVQPYIEGKLSDEECEAFISHVRTCPSCYDELETYYTIYYALRYLDDDKNRSYNMKKVLNDDLRRNEIRIRRTRALRAIYVVLISLAEAAACAVAFRWFLPGISSSLYKILTNLF